MKTLLPAIRIFLFLTVLTGVIYPLLVTGIVQLMFPSKANGSIIYIDGKPAGSVLIGQSFEQNAAYFTSRPSATDYNPMPSGGSNYGLTSRKLKEQFDGRQRQFREDNMMDPGQEVPSEMLFSSASGLDPHIPPEGAALQVERVCRARHFTGSQKRQLTDVIDKLTESPQVLCLGKKRINVLLLNLETDKIK